jgi:hypothetical protein
MCTLSHGELATNEASARGHGEAKSSPLRLIRWRLGDSISAGPWRVPRCLLPKGNATYLSVCRALESAATSNGRGAANQKQLARNGDGAGQSIPSHPIRCCRGASADWCLLRAGWCGAGGRRLWWCRGGSTRQEPSSSITHDHEAKGEPWPNAVPSFRGPSLSRNQRGFDAASRSRRPAGRR